MSILHTSGWIDYGNDALSDAEKSAHPSSPVSVAAIDVIESKADGGRRNDVLPVVQRNSALPKAKASAPKAKASTTVLHNDDLVSGKEPPRGFLGVKYPEEDVDNLVPPHNPYTDFLLGKNVDDGKEVPQRGDGLFASFDEQAGFKVRRRPEDLIPASAASAAHVGSVPRRLRAQTSSKPTLGELTFPAATLSKFGATARVDIAMVSSGNEAASPAPHIDGIDPLFAECEEVDCSGDDGFGEEEEHPRLDADFASVVARVVHRMKNYHRITNLGLNLERTILGLKTGFLLLQRDVEWARQTVHIMEIEISEAQLREDSSICNIM